MPKKIEKKLKTILDLYLEEIGEAPLLGAEGEVTLAKRIELGDNEAGQQFIKSNLRFVVFIAKKYVRKSLNLTLLGLIQEGNLGLMVAVRKFDWRRGSRFSTYAEWWIKRYIKLALFYERRGAIARFSLDYSIGEQNDTFDAITEDTEALPPSSEADKGLLADVFDDVLSELSVREQQVLKLAFGLVDGIAHTDKEIAKKIRKRRVIVQQIRELALRKLRKHKRLIKLVE